MFSKWFKSIIKNDVKLFTTIIFFLSITLIYPLIYFTLAALELGDAVSNKNGPLTLNHDPQILNSVNQYSGRNILFDVEYKIAYIFFIANGIALIFMCVYFFNKFINCDSIIKLYVFFSAFLGIGILIYPFTFVKNKKYKFSLDNLLNWSIISSLIICLGLSISNGLIVTKNLKANYYLPQVKLATKKGSENLILVCIDSFDNEWTMPYFENKNFKDFYHFTNFVTPGFYTAESEKIIYSGGIDNNLWEYFLDGYRLKETPEIYTGLPEIKLKMLFSNEYFKNITVMNDGFNQNVKQNVSLETGKRDFNYTSINERNARKLNSIMGGFNNNVSEKNIVDVFSKNIVISNDPGKVFFSFYSTHNPYFGDSKGKFSLSKGNNSFQSYEMRRYDSSATFAADSMEEMINSMKSKSNKHGNIYDNSMIVLFGDHSSHSNLPASNDGKAGEIQKKNISSLMIKYPHTTLSGDAPTEVDDVAIYGAHLMNIIDHYFNNKNDDQIKWLHENQNFKMDRKFITFKQYWRLMGGYVTQFDKDGNLRLVNSTNGSPAIYLTNGNDIINKQIEEVAWK